MRISSFRKQDGVAIIYVLLLVGVILAIVFSLSAIFFPRIKTATESKNSVAALYAAESALEWCLYVAYVDSVPAPVLSNGATYTKQDGTPLQPSDCVIGSPIKVNGTFRGVTRAFEITP